MSGLWLPGQKTSRRDLHREADAQRHRSNQLYATLAAILIEQGGEARVPLSTLALVQPDIPINAQTTDTELVVTYARENQAVVAEGDGDRANLGRGSHDAVGPEAKREVY